MVTNTMTISEEKKELGLKMERSERWRIIWNVLVLSIAFMVHFTAFQGTANLQSSINANSGLGTISLAALYVAQIVSNMFLPVIIINWLGCKWTVALSLLTYMPYIAAQLWPSFYTLVPAAISTGLGGGPLWCAKCTYLSVVAESYSKLANVPASVLLVTFFGVFFMIYQASNVWGNLISSLVFTTSGNASVSSLNASLVPAACGVNYNPANHLVKKAVFSHGLDDHMRLIACIYLACMALAFLIVVFGLDSLARYDHGRAGSGQGATGLALLSITMKLLKEKEQLLIMVLTTWLGLSQVFITADYTASFISCALGTGYIGFVMICYGATNSLSAFITGSIMKLTGRLSVMMFAGVLQISIIIGLLSWEPQRQHLFMFYGAAALWGICDGVWFVQINAFCGLLFPGREEAAYSNFRLWKSAGYIVAYLYAPVLATVHKLIILLAGLLLGLACYLVLEYSRRIRMRVSRMAPEESYEPVNPKEQD